MNAGRPRDFDEETVLDSVMNSFWRNGFDQATFEQLVADSGLSRSSLYNAFGGKEALFEKAIERYIEKQFRQFQEKLSDEQQGGEVLARFVEHFRQPFDARRKDCLLRKTVLHNAANEGNAKEKHQITAYLSSLWKAIGQAMPRRSKKKAQLTDQERAALVVAVQFGSAVLARNGCDDALLSAMTDGIAKVAGTED